MSAYLRSSIGKKQLMGITGLGLCVFVLAHMLGNLLFVIGPDAYNAYGHGITGNKPVYYTIEMGLLACFVLHVVFAIIVSIENRKARPVGYAKTPGMGKKGAADFSSKTMQYSGMLVFAFVVLHLIKFRFGEYYPYDLNGHEIRDLHKLMVEVFVSAGYTAWYLFSLLILAFHLSHALWSSIQTLGLIPPGKECGFRIVSRVYGWGVAIGFAVVPVYVFFMKGFV